MLETWVSLEYNENVGEPTSDSPPEFTAGESSRFAGGLRRLG
jgi:hypothetical protein